MRLILVAFIAAALAACSDGFAPSSAPQAQAKQQPTQGAPEHQQASAPPAPTQGGFDATSALLGAAVGYMLGSDRPTQQVVQAPAQVAVAPPAAQSKSWFRGRVWNSPQKPVAVAPSVPKPAPAPAPTSAPAAPQPKPAPKPSFASSAYKQPSKPTVTYRSGFRRK